MSCKLYQYQIEHLTRLVHILDTHGIAIDSSVTGSGKTIVAIEVAKIMSTRNNLPVIVVCPPTLVEHWHSYIEGGWTVVSSYSLHSIKPSCEFMLIVDECHLFKNAVKRTSALKRIQRKSKYTLMLSATPYDDPRQFTNIKEIFGIQTDIKLQLSRMKFEYSTRVSFLYYHIYMEEEFVTMYKSGYLCINQSVQNEEGVVTFKPQMFTSGIRKIHDSLFLGTIDYIKALFNKDNQTKFIVVLNFMEHFNKICSYFPTALILNGTTPMKDRAGVIEAFQEDNLTHRLICISGEVGSVGIELDDKTGKYPRHMIVLPMSNAINFCQAIGRIQRTRTKSDSRVTVIQPIRKTTYFKHQISRKFQVLGQFMTVPTFKNQVERHKCVAHISNILCTIYPKNIWELIIDFLCDCI